jgi:hypothetical protein
MFVSDGPAATAGSEGIALVTWGAEGVADGGLLGWTVPLVAPLPHPAASAAASMTTTVVAGALRTPPL